jgi:hypothetical protein
METRPPAHLGGVLLLSLQGAIYLLCYILSYVPMSLCSERVGSPIVRMT